MRGDGADDNGYDEEAQYCCARSEVIECARIVQEGCEKGSDQQEEYGEAGGRAFEECGCGQEVAGVLGGEAGNESEGVSGLRKKGRGYSVE